MITAIVVFLVALMITVFSTPWARLMAIGLGFVDAPAQRKLHGTPMPLMGGVAIFAGAILAVLLFANQMPRQVAGVLLASSVVAFTGLVDDRRSLPAWIKLLGQFVGFAILAYWGVRVRLPLPLWANYIITFIWLTGISNAINFLDNMDGLSAGISGVAAAFILLMGLQNEQFLVFLVGGGCVGRLSRFSAL